MKKISVVVPVYFNEGSLPPLFQELLGVERQLADLGVELELIFVDDGSGDGSYAELLKIKAARPATRVVKLSRNFGAVHASKAALQFVTGDAFMPLAADLQDPPALIVEMARRWLAGSKFVTCVRAKRADPPLTTLFAKAYYRLLRAVVVDDYPDGGYDLALMDKALLAHLRASGKNSNPNVFAFWLGFKPDVIPYERRERVHGKSRWTFRKKWKFFLDTMLGFSIVPLRLISLTGMVVSAGSLMFVAFVVVNGLLGRYDVPGFATLASIIAFLLGLVICMLGVMGEYLWRIFDEINGRPEAVIDEVL
ncbi:glycosyltransferase family 2 protein [Gemmata sp. JC717]|uniref:Glycosyltransferase family 2 protein n=1 Tax=Gemmata algarum TaxID=2975278 RepID=A0ABU5EVS5_9BACT|nr:glycosyltransferase family 2 protein [Gemmata algarum]MDY3554278.1 glycosyltransferase family 2 protein [Gemmata algarum]MDY3559073.1 glycosyltransferase family 2 protein [Gemmata algarum]